MKIERMLIAVDFSDTASKAARYAATQFAPKAELTLLHVIDPLPRPRFAREILPPEDALEEIAREYAARRMVELSASLAPARVRTEFRVGRPDEQVVAMASEVGATVVVIGPHDDRPRPWKFLGTTADRIARTCPVPVLVATSPTEHSPRRILVPVDDDGITSEVLAFTRDLAERFDADVSLLYVVSNAVYGHVASMSYATTPSEARAKQEIEKELTGIAAHWLEEIARAGVNRDRVTLGVAYGNAGDVAVETAATLNADLIVIGRRGSGLVRPALLGSTVGTVLYGARCPVLVVTNPSDAR
jgi:nucleotide-binding universal stress UspA family protein